MLLKEIDLKLKLTRRCPVVVTVEAGMIVSSRLSHCVDPLPLVIAIYGRSNDGYALRVC